MKHPLRISRMLIAIFFYGSVVGFTSGEKESGECTWLDVAAGFGSLTKVVRDCSGNVINHDDYSILEGGLSIRHTTGYLAVTGKATTFQVRRQTFNIPASFGDSSSDLLFTTMGIGAAVGLNTPIFGLDVGAVYFTNTNREYFPFYFSHIQPMWKLRIGFEDRWYFSTSFFYNTMTLSQGGIFDMGLGFRFAQTKSSLWFGIGEGPYSDDQFVIRIDIVPSDWNSHMLLSGNVGFGDDGSTEYGIALGVKLQLK